MTKRFIYASVRMARLRTLTKYTESVLPWVSTVNNVVRASFEFISRLQHSGAYYGLSFRHS